VPSKIETSGFGTICKEQLMLEHFFFFFLMKKETELCWLFLHCRLPEIGTQYVIRMLKKVSLSCFSSFCN